MEILNQTFDSLLSYFDTLRKFGYMNNKEVEKLLIFIYIEELVTGELREFITEADYRDIENALYCLYGSSCLIPYPELSNSDSIWHRTDSSILLPRITEDNIVRFSEDDRVRFKATNYNDWNYIIKLFNTLQRR